MTQKLNLTLKTTIFHKPQQLIIQPDFIQLNNGSADTKFVKDDIDGIRNGVKGIRGYKFYIGRVYCIDIRNKNNEVLNIRIKTLYRIGRKLLDEKYIQIINALFENYFHNIILKYLKQFDEENKFEIENVSFVKVGVVLDGKRNLLLWNDIGIRKYITYFTIFSKSNQHNYKIFEYRNDWNSSVIYNVIKSILKKKCLFDE